MEYNVKSHSQVDADLVKGIRFDYSCIHDLSIFLDVEISQIVQGTLFSVIDFNLTYENVIIGGRILVFS